jgi:hypothetical protein
MARAPDVAPAHRAFVALDDIDVLADVDRPARRSLSGSGPAMSPPAGFWAGRGRMVG